MYSHCLWYCLLVLIIDGVVRNFVTVSTTAPSNDTTMLPTSSPSMLHVVNCLHVLCLQGLGF